MFQLIQYGQIVIAVLVIAAILMQNHSAGVSAVFGGGDSVGHTRRGAEKWLFNSTIILVFLFIALGVASLILQN
jgi:protein translocase SecG subunit